MSNRVRLSVLGCVALGGCHTAGPAPAITFIAHDFGYEMPARIPAGLVRLRLVNRGAEVHEGMLTRLTGGTASAAGYVDSVRAGVNFPAYATDVGGPGLSAAGDSSTVWLNLEAGRYAVICWKGDHLRRGMAHDLEVIDSASLGPVPLLPQPSATVTLADYAFGVSAALRPGRQLIHLRNDGTEPHEADLFRLPEGVTVKDYIRWVEAGETGTPPAEPVGGIGDLAPGREIWLEVTLSPGRYFWFCEVPGPDGKSHFEKGMVSEFVVD